MSSLNAPQPDAPVGNNTEVFDSTIVPAQGQVSQDQLPGPNNSEAPVHTGEANTFDIFFLTQFMALTSFIWDTSASVGQLLWFLPIHPTFVHQFMAHISKMYNAYAGGFDFAMVIAGTGFHAGKLVIVRLPPNIHPNSLKTMADITAFPYFVMDPKTLQAVVKSAMDQRNVMYHYLPYDEKNIQSFGGWIAVYVMLPLNTSATGATQISVQVFSKPAQDFMFSQIRPINDTVLNPFKPVNIEHALDFRTFKESPLFRVDIDSIKVHAPTDLKQIGKESLNCLKLDKTPMQVETVERFNEINVYDFDRINKETVKAIGIQTAQLFEIETEKKYIGFNIVKGDKYLLSFDAFYTDSTRTKKMPKFFCKPVYWGIKFLHGDKFHSFMIQGELRPRTGDDPDGVQEIVFQWEDDLDGWAYSICEGTDCFKKQYLDNLIKNNVVQSLVFKLGSEPTFEINYQMYAPPIEESIVTFSTGTLDFAQPEEFRKAILYEDYSSVIGKENSMVFELVDNVVGLPLLPVRLHYNGYFTAPVVKKTIIYKFEQPLRYSFKFIGIIPETTPLVSSRLPLESLQKYAMNQALSKFHSSL